MNRVDTEGLPLQYFLLQQREPGAWRTFLLGLTFLVRDQDHHADESSHISEVCLGLLALEQNGLDTSVFWMWMFAFHSFLPSLPASGWLLSLPVCLLPAAPFLPIRISWKRRGFEWKSLGAVPWAKPRAGGGCVLWWRQQWARSWPGLKSLIFKSFIKKLSYSKFDSFSF